ncbi:MAG: hypothetical protein BMS9Abin05_0978 [Rhodothermia bacterium]|nr:MAG: hypothetical protein BMS9Abin05_0978 [Rhodothermia bacterium]
MIKEDLRFIRKLKIPRSLVIWHDPNFGIRFNEILGTIEEAIPSGSLKFLAESSLSLLKEDNLKRLKENGFKVIMPGIESWFEMGDKSKARNIRGMEKVKRVAGHLNMVRSYIPYVQANLIFGLDTDVGSEPFELTKKFLALSPGIYPHFALLSSFGRNAELNLGYQRENRVLGTPFHFLNLFHSMNVIPKNYTWPEFYGYVADIFDFAFGPEMVGKRFRAGKSTLVRIEQRYRAISSDRNHRGRFQHRMIDRLNTEKDLRQYLEGETTSLPRFYTDAIKRDLGPMWKWLPEGAMYHDPNAYLKSTQLHRSIEVMAEA